MQSQARRDTAPELGLRRVLHASGYRYRVNQPVPGMGRRTMDLAFTRYRVAVMVHGCFWHGCPEHGTQPTANGEWWLRKIAGNVRRDAETKEHLERLGWTVLSVWEHEDSQKAAFRVGVVLVEQRQMLPGSAPGASTRGTRATSATRSS